MSKQIKIRIYPDGKIESETVGVKGSSCLNLIKDIEDLTGAQTVKSQLTKEYYETDNAQVYNNNEDYQQNGY